MTTALQIFNHEEFGDVRVVMREGEPWFVAADVCRVLELTNVTETLKRLDDDEKAKFNLGLPGGDTNVVNEAGLYRLIFASRKPEAKTFQRWVFHEVLPSIRKTGSYSIEPKQYTPVADAIADVRKSAEEIQTLIIGVQRGIAITKIIDSVEKTHNIPLQSLKELLPPAEHETGYLNPTQIGERLGGIPPRTVNKMLAAKGVEYKCGDTWRLTEDGKAYGEEIPYTRNGHSGYQIRWSERVMELFDDEEATV